MRNRVLFATLLCLAIGLSFGAPAALAQYPPPGAIAGVTDSVVTPGDDVTVFGSGWLPGSLTNLQFQSAPVSLGSAQVNAQGSFSKVVSIPSNASPGQHSIVVSGTASNGQADSVFVPVQVLGPGGGGGGGGDGGGTEPGGADTAAGGAEGGPLTIPFTGIVIRMWMAAAAGLLFLGLVALIAGVRRGRVRY